MSIEINLIDILEEQLAEEIHSRVKLYAVKHKLSLVSECQVRDYVASIGFDADQLAEEIEIAQGLTFDVEEAYDSIISFLRG